jgi:hypothetical protein
MKNVNVLPQVFGCAVVVVLALVPSGCKRANKIPVQQTVEEAAPRMASVVRMSDPKLETQLVSGFYGIEGNAWRWTGKQFSVVLRPPSPATQGGVLELDFTIPQVNIDKLKTVTLSASVDGTPLPPETYSTAGSNVYKHDVPANLLSGESVKVDFQLDRAVPPQGADRRDLGVVANSVGLSAK